MGQVKVESDIPNARVLVKGSYRIIYVVREKDIIIVTVRHGRQRPTRVLVAWARDLRVPDDPPTGLIC